MVSYSMKKLHFQIPGQHAVKGKEAKLIKSFTLNMSNNFSLVQCLHADQHFKEMSEPIRKEVAQAKK